MNQPVLRAQGKQGFSQIILMVIIGVVLVIGGGWFWYYQQSTNQGDVASVNKRDDFGCFSSSCKYFPEGSPKQMCDDWKADRQVKWPDCSFLSSFPKCHKLCEFEKKNN